MTATLGHFERISNGEPTADRPRGLHPALFGPGGMGWSGVAVNVIPLVRPGMPVVFWLPGGNEPDGSISDRPFYHARRDDPGSVWTAKLCNVTALAGCLASIRVVTAGAPIWFYIGTPRQPEPDGMIWDLVRSGLVQGVCFDAIVLQPRKAWSTHVAAYERDGAKIGYEELPTWNRTEFWKNPEWTCFGRIATFNAAQAKVGQYPIHDNREVDERAIAGPVMLLDTGDDVPSARSAMNKGQHVAANLASPPWRAALAPVPTTNDDDGA